MADEIKVAFEATWGGQTVRADGLATFKFKAPQTELANIIKSVLMIDHEIRAVIKTEKGDVYKLGKCSFNRLTTDRHGESVLSVDTDLNSMSISLDAMRDLVDVTFKLALWSKVE